MGRKKPTNREDESTTATLGGAKSKKKSQIIDDDEYSIGTEISEDQPGQQAHEDEEVRPVAGKKKGKKGSSKVSQLMDGEKEKESPEEGEEEDDVPAIVFAGKKKPKGKKSGNGLFSTSNFGLLEEDDEPLSSLTNDGQEEGAGSEADDSQVVSFSGKKKPSKKNNSLFTASAFDLSLDENNENRDEDHDNDVDDPPVIAFTGKKKSSKKKNSNSSSSNPTESVMETDDNEVTLDAPKPADDVGIDKEVKEVVETSKSKKKKKKTGRTAQEEDDLDKILAELGEGTAVPKPAAPPPEPQEKETVEVQPEPVEKQAEEEGVESAAAKKKKKKKEKEKEKKAAAAAVEVKEEKKEEAKSKVLDKKVPKHVREMQEALARRQEAEERKKREEEERLRKEEEERRRQEELERQAEEARRRKKEREKEKLLKKKQEGKLLTGKQKEEARRLEAMRNQILANAGGLPLPTNTDTSSSSTAKRPKYQTKKTKPPPPQADGSNAPSKEVEVTDEKDTLETKNVEEETPMNVEEELQVDNVIEENRMEEEVEDEDDEEWDAKSWDDESLLKLPSKSAFADEEVDSEPEPSVAVAKREETKPSSESDKPITAAKKASQVVSKTNESHAPVMENNRRAEDAAVNIKRETPSSDAQSLAQSEATLRSPICCIMGHVDTGKTKLLDCIRGTNVQEGEAGGITQQIGATYFPAENIRERTKELKADAKLKVPGLLVIDTPGHESFTNLRSRGSGLCDIAILVVDIMHGLEPQTIESLNLLKMRNTEFIVALNKVDRLYGWKICRNAPIVKAMKQQTKDVQNEFNRRLSQIITQFMEQGLNTELYYKNKEMGETFSIVPTSAITGEGIPDLLLLLVQWTQKTMIEKLTFSNEVQCTVLEVKVVEGHGTTIDVVLVNGILHEGDQIVVCGMQGPIVTSIRALLTPHPMKELRVKGTYLHHKEIKAAQGIKITGQGLEHAVAGTALYVVGPNDDVEDIKELAMEDMKSVMSRIDRSGEGVCVQASTLGSLEALLAFLKTPAVNIPVSGISIGPVHKKDVMKASVMLEKKKEFATILAFDVKVTPEARELADEVGVKIFIADIIYHLFDQFKAYIENLKEEKKKEASDEAVFPCVLKIMPNCIFNKKDPIVLGVDVLDGIVKIGTPICIPDKDFIDIGRIASIEINKKQIDVAKKGQMVAIKIVGTNPEEQQKMYGRHFEMEDALVSHITRRSIDILKANYRDDLSMEDWKLVLKLKNLFKIP